MDFVELISTPIIWPFVVCVIVGILLIMLGFGLASAEDKKVLRKVFITGGFAGLLVLALGIWGSISSICSYDNSRNERKSVIAQEIVDTYGLTIKQNQITTVYGYNAQSPYSDSAISLNYPSEKPVGNFETFGSVTVKFLDENDELVESRVTLVWVDGEMRLYGQPEGEEIGAEFPRVEQE